MFPVQCEESRIDHVTPFLVVTMPYACWFLWHAYYIEGFQWCLHFQFGVAFCRVVLREVCFEGPNRVWRALKTSILNTGHDLVTVRALASHPKAVPWVLGKSFYVVTGPHAWCEVRRDHVARLLHVLLAGKRGEDLVWYNMSRTLSIWENHYGGVCLSWNLCWTLPCNLSYNLSCWEKMLKKVTVSQNLC